MLRGQCKMQSKSIYKVPNGKLLKVFLDYDNNSINQIKITGDFFAHPEEAIEAMENELKNCALEKEKLLLKIDEVIKSNKIEFFGLDAENLVQGILMAVK